MFKEEGVGNQSHGSDILHKIRTENSLLDLNLDLGKSC